MLKNDCLFLILIVFLQFSCQQDQVDTIIYSESDLEEQALNFHLAGVEHYLSDDYEIAIKAYQKALEIRSQLTSERRYIGIAMTTLNMGIVYLDYLDQAEKAIPLLQQAKDNFTKDGTRPDKLAQTYQYISQYYEKKGEIGQMENYINLGYINAQLALSLAIEQDTFILKRRRLLGQIYETKGRQFNSIEVSNAANKAIDAYKNALMVYQNDTTNFLQEIAVAYEGLGISYLYKKNYEETFHLFEKTISLLEQAEDWENLLLTINNLTVLLNRNKQFEKAKQLLKQSIETNVKKKNYDLLAANYNNLADTYFYQNQPDSTLKYHQQAITTSISNYNPDSHTKPDLTHPETAILSKPDLLTYLGDKANAQTKFNQLKFALETYKTADQLLSLLKQDLQTQQAQLFWQEKAAPIYQSALETAHQLYQKTNDTKYLDQMFQFSEKNKASILYDAVVNVQAKTNLIPLELLERERIIKTQLGQYEQAVLNQPENETKALSQLIAQREIHQGFIDSLEQAYPNYHSLKYKTDTTTIADIQEHLIKDHQTAVLEYFISTQHIYIFAITKNDFKVHQITKPTDFDTQLQALQISLNQDDDFENYSAQAYQIYQNYVKPALENLDNQITKLILLPDNQFTTIPHEALLYEPVKQTTTRYQGLPYLINRFQMTYAYSAALLLEKQHWANLSSTPLLGFAPKFEDLFLNETTMLEINKIANGLIFTKEEATKERLINWKENINILHLNTHAEMDDYEPLNNRIYLADSATITTSEIYNLPFRAKLAVLSACETGKGKIAKGEGIMSLARAFMYSGCPSVVTSLWKVEEQQTAQLMQSFYAFLKEGLPKDEALHQAKLSYLNSQDKDAFSNPFYWAAFVHIGDVEAINFPASGLRWMVLTSVGLGIIILFIFLKIHRSS